MDKEEKNTGRKYKRVSERLERLTVSWQFVENNGTDFADSEIYGNKFSIFVRCVQAYVPERWRPVFALKENVIDFCAPTRKGMCYLIAITDLSSMLQRLLELHEIRSRGPCAETKPFFFLDFSSFSRNDREKKSSSFL